MPPKKTGNPHLDSLASRLNEQRKSGGAFCDVLLKVGGQTLPTHACVLSACSPFFHGIICADRPQPPHLALAPQEIELRILGIDSSPSNTTSDGNAVPDAGLETMLQLLDYIYTGHIELRQDSVHLLVQLAEVLALDGLSALVRDYVDRIGGTNGSKKPEEIGAVSTKARRGRRRSVCGPRKGRLRRSASAVSSKPKDKGEPKKLKVADQLADDAKPKTEEPQVTDEEVVKPPSTSDSTTRILRRRKRVRVSSPIDEGDSSADPSSSDNFSNLQRTAGGRAGKKGTYKCGECEFESREPPDILEHRLAHPRGKSFVCLSCGFFSGYYSKMLEHLRDADHAETKCSLCGVECDNQDAFTEHLLKHENLKPFFCQLCDMRFRIKCHLTRHLARHSADRPFVCDVCGRGFKNKHFMLIHVSNHSAVKSFACPQCDYRTSFKTNLNMHIRGHREGKLQCPREGCKFQSISKYNLQSHLLTHAKQKPFQCEVCGQKFAQERSRRRHAKTHNPELMLHCDRCIYTTVSKHRMSEHIYKVHENGPPRPRKERVRKPPAIPPQALVAQDDPGLETVMEQQPEISEISEVVIEQSSPPPSTLPTVGEHFQVIYEDCQPGIGAVDGYGPRIGWFP